MSSEAQNLERLVDAIKLHEETCEFPTLEIQMNPFELERLGWDEIMNIPITGNPSIPTGRFRIICDNVELEEEVEAAIGEEMVAL